MARQKRWFNHNISVLFIVLWSSASWASASKMQFEKSQIQIGKIILDVDVAKTAQQQMRGLMYVKKMPQNYGMIFVYDHEDHRSFWMKNTLIPLSIGFFDANKKLVEIADMKPVKSFLDKEIDSVVSKKPAQYALEVNQGWFEQNKIQLGTSFKWIKHAEKPKN